MKHILKDKEQGGLGYSNKSIFIFGRSIGTGPACQFASKFNPRGLILISAYTSIKSVAANIAGKFLSWFVNVHFNNLESMTKINCPAIMIHGEQDELIPSTHSEKLYSELIKRNSEVHEEFSKLVLHAQMTHNNFNMMNDLLMPIKEFIIKLN